MLDVDDEYLLDMSVNNDFCVCSSCLPMFLANCGYLELVLVVL